MVNPAYATVAVLAGTLVASAAIQKSAELDETVTASIASPPALHAPGPAEEAFRLTSSASQTQCVIVVARASEGEVAALRFAPDCIANHRGLARAHYWLERPDGSVAFSGRDGNIIAEFAVADGAAFESYSPTAPVITLQALD